ncbi:MAG: macro domain-containing protein [Candidatus Daviesbacteria bacterium]|nr:macro domain-containing protein [Candidatus Daviesbacteria bacterium]
MNIRIQTNDITNFSGDLLIIPCNSDLTSKRIGIVQKILEKGGKDLLRELIAIGYCEVGNAVIVQGYELKAKHIIFMPIADNNDEEYRINFVGLHQSFRATFDLADLYKAKSVAVAGIHISNKKKDFFKSLWNKYFGDNNETGALSDGEVEDIIISTSKNFENSSIKELIIYKYSK